MAMEKLSQALRRHIWLTSMGVSTAMLLAVILVGRLATKAETGVRTIQVGRGLTKIEADCIQCHSRVEPGKVRDWSMSLHARANVTCLDCHRAASTDKGATDCPGTKKYPNIKISPVVSPAVCSRCHPAEAEEFARSKHARTLEIITKKLKDPWLRGMNSPHERSTGCYTCHGSDLSSGKLDALNWPNSGCGRINPDGSKGACTICHTTHKFSLAEARKPETCGQCHLGPDHPQKEIYFESKHGLRYLAEGSKWNFNASAGMWKPGADYTAPTCTTCHMAGIGGLKTTHDVGERLKWEAQAKGAVLNWDHDPQEARKKMLAVCTQCHSPRWAGNYLARSDQTIQHYAKSYYEPAKAIMTRLYDKGILTKWPVFDEEIEWVFYELWHHEGRRARMGSQMMGPDYSWWHGFYELKRHYQKLVHLARKAEKQGHGNPTFVPGSGGKNITAAKVAPVSGTWKDIEHIEGFPPASPAKK